MTEFAMTTFPTDAAARMNDSWTAAAVFEFDEDVALAKKLLGPHLLAWGDNDETSYFVVEGVRIQTLCWVFSEIPELKRASETLDFSKRFTGHKTDHQPEPPFGFQFKKAMEMFERAGLVPQYRKEQAAAKVAPAPVEQEEAEYA